MRIERNCIVRARAVEAQLTEAKTGTPGIQIVFAVSDGDHKGQRVRWTGWMTDKTLDRTLESLEHCGWAGDDLGEFGDRELHGLDKKEVELVIEMEDYQGSDEKYVGKSFPRVQWVNRAGGASLRVEQAMTKEKASAFGDKMRALVTKSRLARTQGSGTDFAHGANAEKPTGTGRKF